MPREVLYVRDEKICRKKDNWESYFPTWSAEDKGFKQAEQFLS